MDEDRAVFAEDRVQLEHPELRRERITRGHHERRGTVDQLWEMRIEAGECPRGSCSGVLDPESCCPLCGWSLTEHRMRGRLSSVADKPDYLPRLPQALFIEEYGPTAVTEEEAA